MDYKQKGAKIAKALNDFNTKKEAIRKKSKQILADAVMKVDKKEMAKIKDKINKITK